MGEEFKRKLYENGIEIPWNEDIIKGTKVKKSVAPPVGGICKAVSDKRNTTDSLQDRHYGGNQISELFLKDVWNGGDKNIDKLLKS